jgi:TolB-like protein/tetratricopeptide (TPR) repeat protein
MEKKQISEPVRFPGDRLDSWKSIANHLGREVRTVQLWEKLEGMPVHRHFHRKLGSVFAYRSEVDAWREGLSWAPGGSVPLASVAPRKNRIVIAVLPFESLGGNPEQEFFNDGVTVETITALGNLSPQGLGVISRASVMAYKGSPRRAEKLSKELNVGFILEGTTQTELGQIRVNVALVNVKDKTTLWSKSYKSTFANSLDLQSRVAAQIARFVALKLFSSETPAGILPSVGRSALRDAYFMGRYFWKQRTEHALRKAVGIFESAIQEDPGFSLAHSGLADCLTLLSFYEMVPPSEAMPIARRVALKAVELDPCSAEARTSLADILFHFDRDWTRADQEYRAAIQCNPEYGLSYHWYANLLVARGKHEAAHNAIMRALDLDPVSPITNAWAGVISHFGRRYNEAISHYRRALELDPQFVWARMFMAQTLGQMGRTAEALEEFEATVQLSGGSNYVTAMMAHAQAVSGDKSSALKILNELNGRLNRKPMPSYDIAAVYAALGDSRKTIAWLDRALAEHNMKLFTLAEDPRFDPVRNLPQFKHVVGQVGLNSTVHMPRCITSKS